MAAKRSPAVLLGVSIAFAIAGSISLRAAAAMSIMIAAINMAMMIVILLTRPMKAVWGRVIIGVGTATVVMMLTREFVTFVFPDIANFLGTYIYLAALGAMALLEPEISPDKRRRRAFLPVLQSAVLHSLAFAAMVFTASLLREYFGNGSLWGYPVSVPFRMPGMLLPFFGFILIGFLLAAARWLSKAVTRIRIREIAQIEARDRARYTEIYIDQ